MKNLKKDLRTVNNELKALVKKTEKLMKAVDRIEKAKTTKTPTRKAVKTKTLNKSICQVKIDPLRRPNFDSSLI